MQFFLPGKCRRALVRLVIILLPVMVVAVQLHGQIPVLSTVNSVGGVPLEVNFLNVGQGNCVLVKFPTGSFMLYDGGTSSSQHKIDRAAVAARITALTGGDKIATVVLSHPDKDHINIVPMIQEATVPKYVHFSGAPSDYDAHLKEWFGNLTPANTTMVPYPVDYPKGPPVNFNPSASIANCGSVQVYVLAANVGNDPNTKSIVLKILYKNQSVLLTGDATAETESAILGLWASDALKSTALLFSHHGSNHSSIPAFVQAVQPRIGIWSASATHKGYGHPRCSVMDLAKPMVDVNGKNNVTIKTHSISCYNAAKESYEIFPVTNAFFLTATQGDIKFRTDGDNYDVSVNKLLVTNFLFTDQLVDSFNN